MLPITEYVDIICMTYKRSNFPYIKVWCDESCQSIVYSDVSDIGFGGYIVETPINIVRGMWFDVERGNSSTWK
jgi:hypothetical protein